MVGIGQKQPLTVQAHSWRTIFGGTLFPMHLESQVHARAAMILS
jgi:hypothetical protein